MNTNDIVEMLTSDGDTYDLDDERTLRLRIEADDNNPFAETDVYGEVIHAEDRSLYEKNTGRWHRPDHFTGDAEKIQGGRSDTYWWQPPKDGPKRGTPEFVKFRALVRDLIEFGSKIVVIEVMKGTDAYGRGIVIEVASLGGIDSLDDGYLAEVVADLVTELDLFK